MKIYIRHKEDAVFCQRKDKRKTDNQGLISPSALITEITSNFMGHEPKISLGTRPSLNS
jgi:hypothetical protein